ncbi:MAG TPA: hypothetical protein VKV20_03955 [Ktedonobacteraceae bacterium]|jgi:hypothetical protein|nr:hypothetical protein [Ktedonobacteraceae bacterium]
MPDYCSIRIWQLKPGSSARELEALVASGLLEMQRWIPGVKHVSLVRLGDAFDGRYILTTTFTNHEAYTNWRQVEEEGPDYWERYASVMMHWEQMARLVDEYHGELAVDVTIARQEM